MASLGERGPFVAIARRPLWRRLCPRRTVYLTEHEAAQLDASDIRRRAIERTWRRELAAAMSRGRRLAARREPR